MEKLFHRSLTSGFVALIASCFVLGASSTEACFVETNATVANSNAHSSGVVDSTDRIGLVRNWESSIPVTLGEAEGSTVKFVIPANAHPAFYLTRELLDQLLTDPNVTEQERNRFLGNLDVWVTLNTGNFKEVVSSRDRGVHGRILGIEGALRLAEIRKELLTKQGLEIKEELRFIPRATVFALSAGGSLQAMDAETGKIIWSVRLKKGRAPIQGYAVSDHTIAVVNGSTLELYDATTGTKLKEHPVEILPSGPPAIAGNQILVGGANGRIELLIPFGEKSYRGAEGGFSGRLSLPMTELSRSYVWGVEDAVYVSDRLAPARPLFRIPTTQPQRIPPASVGNLMIFPAAEGEVKCFTQSSGMQAWTTFIGEDVVQSPTIVQLPATEATEKTEPEAAAKPPAAAAGDDSDDPFGAGASEPSSDDPFGAPAAKAPVDDDPFGSPAPKAEADPFGGDSKPADDPFGGSANADPFGSSDDPFGGSDDSPFSGGFESYDDEEDETGTPSMLKGQTVDMAKVLKTTDEVRVVLVTESGDAIALDVRTGEILNSFRAANVKKILTVTSKYIYALSNQNDLMALDVRTGAAVGRMPLSSGWDGVVNTISDRVYLQNDNGQILCLRPRANVAPRYAVPNHLVRRTIKLQTAEAEAGAATKTGDDEFDIFGGGSDSGNPFGGDDDPFK